MLKKILSEYQEPIELSIKESIASFGVKTPLRDAIEYSLKNGGKRFRPAIVYLIRDGVAERIGKKFNVKEAALAIEFFHTGSLIADDLPCMDNDDERRACPTLHRAFDEATAILATYALIAAGYDHIRIGAEQMGRADICPLAIEIASINTGIRGATGGQYCDLFHSSDESEENILEIIDKKTGTLFEISFAFGWLFGGGEVGSLKDIQEAARSFGRAFQIHDDILDLDQDRKNLNYAKTVGLKKAKESVHRELENYYSLLKKLELLTPNLTALADFIENN